MQFLANIGGWGDSLYYLVVPFLFVLTIVVFFHELGHFLLARWCGVRVAVFSIGFGPAYGGFTDRHGTYWRVGAFPIGGYVKFLGDDNAASVPDQGAIATMSPEERRHSFMDQKVGSRAAIVFAGPFANFLLAVIIFAGVFMVYGKRTEAPRVDTVVADSAAADGPAGGPWNPETTSDRLPTAISIPSTSPRFISSLQKSLVSRFSHWILPFTSEQVTTGVLPLLSDSPLRFCHHSRGKP